MSKVIRKVDEYEKRTDKQCKRCKGNCSFEGMGGTLQCYGFVPKTNIESLPEQTKFVLAETPKDEAPSN